MLIFLELATRELDLQVGIYKGTLQENVISLRISYLKHLEKLMSLEFLKHFMGVRSGGSSVKTSPYELTIQFAQIR